MDETRAPAISDIRWEPWSQPVLDFLAQPRDWEALNSWCREQRFGSAKLRHCIAWLETLGFARAVRVEGVVLWVSTSFRDLSEDALDFEADSNLNTLSMRSQEE